jgi:putative tricarboxylic transport membrane protein
MIRLRSPKNVLAGLLFLLFAAVLAWQSGKLELGTAGRMGPGYFPLLLAQLLGLLGLGVLVGGLRHEGAQPPRGDWLGLALVTTAIVAFGLVLQRFGFIAAVLVSSALCVAASRPFKPLASVPFILGLVAFCTVVFVWGLKMPVQLLP